MQAPIRFRIRIVPIKTTAYRGPLFETLTGIYCVSSFLIRLSQISPRFVINPRIILAADLPCHHQDIAQELTSRIITIFQQIKLIRRSNMENFQLVITENVDVSSRKSLGSQFVTNRWSKNDRYCPHFIQIILSHNLSWWNLNVARSATSI